MDLLLTRAGRRWQAEQPPAPSVDVRRLGETLPGRPGWPVVLSAVAAVVLIVAGGAVALVRGVGGGSEGPAHQPGSPPAMHGTPLTATVVPWRALRATHPKVGHRYDGLLVSGHISGTAHPGDVLSFTVTLESDKEIALHPCPDYSIGFGRKGFLSGQLNCQQMPYLASIPRQNGQMTDFLPVLPPGYPVSFRMRITVPDERGKQKVLWTLDVPGSAPGFYGIVTVTPGS
jgi:hypothetical protein